MDSLFVLFRDIKSLNVFLTQDCQVRLGDFGETLTLEEAANEAPQQIGTLHWMAPEILENWKVGKVESFRGKSYQRSADCFSLAVVVWECVTGQVHAIRVVNQLIIVCQGAI